MIGASTRENSASGGSAVSSQKSGIRTKTGTPTPTRASAAAARPSRRTKPSRACRDSVRTQSAVTSAKRNRRQATNPPWER